MSSSKKEKLDLNSSNASNKLDEEFIVQFDQIQQDLEKINEESGRSILSVEQKYVNLRQPFYERRAEYIAKIPNFWLVTFSNHPIITHMITDEDEDALTFLKKVEVQDYDDVKSGYMIRFYFGENQYFTNKMISREFSIAENGSSSTTASTINWNPNKSLLSKDKKSKEKTFFDWLSSSSKNNFDEIGEAIKEEIWSNPLHYFLVEDTEMDDGEDGEDDEEGDENDEDGEDDGDDA